MKMVASSKLHHAQQMIENMLPYENMLEHILKAFLASMPEAHTPVTAACVVALTPMLPSLCNRRWHTIVSKE